MSDHAYLLDASALMTLIENEEGATRVEHILRTHSVYITWTSLLEVRYITQQEHDEEEANYRYAHIKSLPVTLVWLINEAILLTASRLKANYRISLADSIIASYAINNNAILLHKDPEFDVLHKAVKLEALPYKH